MLSFALLSVAAGVCKSTCGLDTSPIKGVVIDPQNKCCVDQNDFPSLDGDADGVPISLAISTKEEWTDVFNTVHPATSGGAAALTKEDTNNRYVLACKQAEDLKTIKMTITRDAALTEFGGEWVKLFEKDSWANETNEYEPFTFNEYGAKIPYFRSPSNGLANDAPTEGVLHVYMEVSKDGDFEVMYGNPNIVSGNYWVPIRFQKTLLRVGSPWASCDTGGSSPTIKPYTVGSIVPLLFGGPNLNSIAAPTEETAVYDDVIAELSNTPVPVKVVLEIYPRKSKDATVTAYTDSTESYEKCYKAGNACPEKHSVCEASYCEMDLWKKIIGDLKAAGDVAVLGAVNSKDTLKLYTDSALDAILDGYFYTMDCDADTPVSCSVPDTHPSGKTSVLRLGQPLFDVNKKDDATVYVTLADSDTGLWNPFSWYSTTPAGKWAALVTGATSADFGKTVETLVDRGYGWVYATSEAGFGTKNTLDMSALLAKIAAPEQTARRLQERSLTASAPRYTCDDTLFECQPICVQQTGVVTSRVADSLCASAPLDECACKCYYEAQWTCEGDAVVCKAKFGAGDLETVGDKVCETRGAPKPASSAELRIASTCEPVTEMRGSAPTAQCLAQWGTPEPTEEAPTKAAATTATDAPTTKSTVDGGDAILLDASFATTLAVAALALYA